MAERPTEPDGGASLSELASPNPRPPRHSMQGPVPAWLGSMGEPLYRAVIDRRNRAFDAGKGVTKIELPVVSVGNLSVGGTGKTPMVMHALTVLLEAGLRPCVAMRGYRSKQRSPTVGGGVAGEPPLLIEQARTPTHTSDEADAYRRSFPDVPVIAQPDRIAGLRALLDEPFQPIVDCVVLDDGFQHRKIARQLDVVLIDASRSPFADRLLPRGWLREPVESLGRAQAVVITHAELLEPMAGEAAASEAAQQSLLELTNNITGVHGKPPVAVTAHVWTGLRMARSHALHHRPDLLEREGTVAAGDDILLPLDALLGCLVTGVCAIGNPAGFTRALERTLLADRANPGRLARMFVLPDHDAFGRSAVRSIAESALQNESDWIVSTDKDWSKLGQHSPERWPCPIVRPELSLVFRTGRGAFARQLLVAVGLDPDDHSGPIPIRPPEPTSPSAGHDHRPSRA